MRASLAAFVSLIAALFAASPVFADTNFAPYPYGAPGDAGATDRCPEGAYLVGVHASTGDWVNQLGIVCAKISADGQQLGPDIRVPLRGSRPGGDADHKYGCGRNEVVTGFLVIATESKKQVVAIIFNCSSITGLANVHVLAGPEGAGARSRPEILGVGATQVNSNNQPCRQGEAGYAVAFRYGKDVNALGLLCRALVAAPPSDPHAGYTLPPPPPSAPSKPIKTTGRPAAPPSDAPPSSPPPAASNIPPESTAPAVSSLPAYAGIWTVVTVQNAQYEMILSVDGDALTGEFKNLQNDIYSGTLTGKLVPDRASITWIQPRNLDSTGQPSQGTGTIKVHTDNTLGGGITFKDPGEVQGHYYRWYGTLVRALPVAKHPAPASANPASANPGAGPNPGPGPAASPGRKVAQLEVRRGSTVYKSRSGKDEPDNKICEVRRGEIVTVDSTGPDKWMHLSNIHNPSCSGQSGWVWNDGDLRAN